jgi:hypothetical protein
MNKMLPDIEIESTWESSPNGKVKNQELQGVVQRLRCIIVRPVSTNNAKIIRRGLFDGVEFSYDGELLDRNK